MDSISELIEHGREALTQIFEDNGIKAPVTTKNVTNAIVAMPEVKAAIVAKFEGFEGFSDEETDSLFGRKLLKGKKTPEEKAARNEKIKGALNKALNIANTVKSVSSSLKQNNTQTESVEDTSVSKDSKKILGLEAWMFWAGLVIVLLIITFILVKAFKK